MMLEVTVRQKITAELIETFPYAAPIEKIQKLHEEMSLLLCTLNESNEYAQTIKTVYEKIVEIKEELEQVLDDDIHFGERFLADLESRVGGGPSVIEAIDELITLENSHLIPDKDM